MMDTELDDFLAQFNEASSDSVSVEHQLKEQKSKNKELQSYLVVMKDATKDILAMYKTERLNTSDRQQKLDTALQDFNALQRQYDELERTNINKNFSLTELMNEMKQSHQVEHLDYIELAQDYFEMMSETTCFYNYEIKKAQGRIISKTEKFLYNALGESYKKPKVIRSKRANSEDDVKSTTSRSSSRVSKRLANKSKGDCDTKRRKTEIWDMKSISQASSPAGTMPFDFEETSDLSSEICEAESICSFNTFSIGNETSFSYLQSQKNSPTQPRDAFKCKCHLYNEEPTLVSIGTNTDPPEQPLPSLPTLLGDEIDFSLDETPETVSRVIAEPTENCEESSSTEVPSTSGDELTMDNDLSKVSDSESLEVDVIKIPAIKNVSPAILDVPVIIQSKPAKLLKETVEQGTSMELAKCLDKSTATVRSTTTRGTSTLGVATKSCGVQFPEISIESIFSETIFDLPDCLSPIEDFELPSDEYELPRIETKSSETMTNLCNVNREIDFVSKSTMKFKTESLPIESFLSSRDPEDDSFIILGQTLFDLFLKRIQKSNKALSNDEITRRKIWKHLKRQLLDRFSELTFDETLNASFSDSELFERISVDDNNNNGRKVGHENFAVASEDFDAFDETILQSEVVDTVSLVPEVSEKELLESDVLEKEPLEPEDVHENLLKPKAAKENLLPEVTEILVQKESNAKLKELELCIKVLHPEVLTKEKQKALVEEEQPEIELERVGEKTIQTEDDGTGENQFKIPAVKETENTREHSALKSLEQISEESSENYESKSAECVEMDCSEFDEIYVKMQAICFTPPQVIEPIEDLYDVIWGSLFPDKNNDGLENEDCPASVGEVLDGFDVEHDPIEIPTEVDEEVQMILRLNSRVFTEFEAPKSPPPFTMCSGESSDYQTEIPIESSALIKKSSGIFNSVLEFSQDMRMSLLTWQQRRAIKTKLRDKKLCKTRKSIKTYLDAEWTDENLAECLKTINSTEVAVIVEAVFETIEDNKSQKDVNTEFTTPAPPLPRYQQKFILLIKKLSEKIPNLHHKLIEDLEEKLFRLENSSLEMNDLRNIGYYYSALMDLFFDGDHTTVFYFIVKCIYFFGYKSVPMIFVLVKAFPQVFPKKSQLLKKYSQGIEWENMTGLELSKVRLDLEWMDSLDMTVMHLVANMQQFKKKGQDSSAVRDHELFSFMPKFYGFPLNFITGEKLLQVLMKRLVDGQLENLSMSLILLARRSSPDFTLKKLVNKNLMPMLNNFIAEFIQSEENASEQRIVQICLLIEVISAVTKTFSEEKDKSFKEIFPMILSILSRVKNELIKENCIKAILRLQRFIDNHKEIYAILLNHQQNSSVKVSDGLRFAIQTFIHRKNKKFCKNST